MVRPKLGDLIEIQTPKGLGYAQYINRRKRYGALIQGFSGLLDERPTEPKDAIGDVQFVCFFPLQTAVNQEIVAIVSNAPVSEEASVFPTFRAGTVAPASGKVVAWWFWDGEREWRVGSLTPEQRFMPIRGIWNDTLLIERMLSGWRPENHPAT